MKYIFSALIALFLCCAALALPGPDSNYNISVGGGGGNDPATTAWVNQVVTRGGTVSGTQTTNVNNLVLCLKNTASTWSIADTIYLEASENTTQATTDLVLPSRTQATSTATFTANLGFTGNGSTTFADSKWAPATGPNCTLNSCAWLMYNATSTDVGNNSYGAFSAGGSNSFLLRIANSTTVLVEINQTGGSGIGPFTNSQGIFIGSRTGASATQGYRNGTSLGTTTDASVGLTASTVYMAGGVNNAGSLAAGAADTFGLFAAFGALNTTQAPATNTCFRTYLTAVGAP